MSVAAADLHKAVNAIWEPSGLDWEFKKYWPSSKRDEFPSLHDQEAGPSTPFPYCIFEQEPGSTAFRMSHTSSARKEIRDIEWQFRAHARAIADVSLSAKELAASLIDVIMQKFGGHPTETPHDLTLDNGDHLLTQYVNDYGVRTGDDEYSWILRYRFRLDVPVAA